MTSGVFVINVHEGEEIERVHQRSLWLADRTCWAWTCPAWADSMTSKYLAMKRSKMKVRWNQNRGEKSWEEINNVRVETAVSKYHTESSLAIQHLFLTVGDTTKPIAKRLRFSLGDTALPPPGLQMAAIPLCAQLASSLCSWEKRGLCCPFLWRH